MPLLILGAGNAVTAVYADIVIGVSLAAFVNAHLFRRLFDKISV